MFAFAIDSYSFCAQQMVNEALMTLSFWLLVYTGGKGPMIAEHMHDVYARPGESARFECRITGEPQPDITWYVSVP